MQPSDDARYFSQREAEEREAAQRSNCVVRGVHQELAEGYALRAASAREDSENRTN